MKDGKKLVYSGDSLRRFLHRKGLTYKDAAKELGLDKNTIGKAVRGGNILSSTYKCNFLGADNKQ